MELLGSRSIHEEIEKKINDLLLEFKKRYEDGEQGLARYIQSIF